METVVIAVLLIALLLIIIAICIVLYILANVIKTTSEKMTYLTSQVLTTKGMYPENSVKDINDEIKEEYRNYKQGSGNIDPHQHLKDLEEYDE